MKTLFILLLTAVSMCAATIDRERFLSSLAEVETGNNPLAVGRSGERGAYQLSPAAYRDLKKFPSSAPPNTPAHVRFYLLQERRMNGAGVPLTVNNMSLVWNLGFEGAKRRKWKSTDYSRRVKNIYERRT